MDREEGRKVLRDAMAGAAGWTFNEKGIDAVNRMLDALFSPELADARTALEALDDVEQPDLANPYDGCPVFEQHGACHCSTGVLGSCARGFTRPEGEDQANGS